MTVAFFNRSYWPDTGATGQLLTELAEDLVAHHGWTVTVVCGYPLRADASVPARERRRGVDIVRASGTTFDPRRFAGRAANYLTYFFSACRAALGLSRTDVVVAMTDPPIIGLAALAMARWRGARFVFLCEDVFPEVAVLVEDFQSGIVNRLLEQVNRFLLRRADAVITLGDTMTRRLVEGKGADPGKIRAIHNWADLSMLAPGEKENAFRRAHGLSGRFVVMHAGNIGLSQNLDAVIEAAARLRADDRIRFVFVGDGAKRAALEAAVRARDLGNVVFVPYQPREAMPMSYAAADLFLVSLRPGLAGFIVPSKVYSILAAGRPFIAAVEADSEPVEIATRWGCGVVVEPGDAAALAAGISELAGQPERVAAMGERARAAAANFDRPRQVSQYAAVLAATVGSA